MLEGQTLGGRYVILSQLGSGGMGAVFEARDTQRGCVVAIKVLTGPARPKDLVRFEREARTAARLEHPAIVRMLDVAMPSNGEPAYLVMERLSGQPLSSVLTNDGRLSPARALELAHPIVSALAAAHDAGIIHRDVKPSNVMIERADGERARVKVVDFGLAREVDAESLTTTGAVLGTVAYMSPEQALGRRGVGPQADVWALGLVLYRMLTGRLPHRSALPGEIIAGLYRGDLDPIREVAPELAPELIALVERATAHAPEDRYPTARAMLVDLERVLAAAATTRPGGGGIDPGPTLEDPRRLTPPADPPRAAHRGASGRSEDREQPGRGHGRIWLASALATVVVGGGAAAIARAVAPAADAPPSTSGAATASTAAPASAAPRPDDLGPSADPQPTPDAARAASADAAASSGAVASVAPAVPAPRRDGPAPSAWRARFASSAHSGFRSDEDASADSSLLRRKAREAVSSCLPRLAKVPCDGGLFNISMDVTTDDSGRVRTGQAQIVPCRVGGHARDIEATAFEGCVRPKLEAIDFGPTRGPSKGGTARLTVSFEMLVD